MGKRKYLYRLVLISCIMILIPTLFAYSVFLKKSYTEIKQHNEKYYDNLVHTFSDAIINEIENVKEFAANFSVHTKSKEKINEEHIFYNGTKKMLSNPFYMWEATNELKAYQAEMMTIPLGVYFYDADFVLYENTKADVKKFLEVVLGVNVFHEEYERLMEFFSAEAYNLSKVMLAPLWSRSGSYDGLLVGFCTNLGKDKEKALVFSRIEVSNLAGLKNMTQGWEKYYVVESGSEELLLGVGDLGAYDQVQAFCRNTLDALDSNEELQDIYVQQTTLKYGLTFIVDSSENAEQNIVQMFYRNVSNYMIYVLLAMSMIGCLAVYFNYRPVLRLSKLIKGRGDNEFDSIYNSWNEQQEVVVDLLMNHLIYGMPIPIGCVDKLDDMKNARLYCVYTITDYVLDTREVEDARKELETDFDVTLFITDLEGEKTTAIVAFFEIDETVEMEKKLCKWCEGHIVHEYEVFMGTVVEQLNDIRKSLDSCKEQYLRKKRQTALKINQEKIEKQRVEKYDQMTEVVIAYTDTHYQNIDFDQNEVADYVHASTYTISRMFKKEFGMSFPAYVNLKRMEKAKEFLRDTDIPIKQVSKEVGFADENYFSRMFKTNYGMAPVEYRKDIKEKK